jgi:hypothetical protein
MTDEPTTTLTDPVLRLAEYWFSAQLMHHYVHELREAYPGLKDLEEDVDLRIEFFTYLQFWLSALYVVAEGFIELRLTDPELDGLVKCHIDSLRLYRNATFHFQEKPNKHVQFFGADRLNWAEELHSSFEKFFLKHTRGIEARAFLRWRARRNSE